MRYVLLVQYDGTLFSGFQRQKKGERTVQGELERAASEVFGSAVRVAGSGRTDAGVHAAAQVCHVDGETSIPAEKLRECLNRKLPPDLKVLASRTAPDGFDCTRAVKKKTYVYRAYFAPAVLPLLSRYTARLTAKPDVLRMREAATLLVGEHDFRAFSSTGSSAKTSVRTVYHIGISEKKEPAADLYEIAVTGNGFLYNMVRILAGELFAVGCGKSTDGIRTALEKGTRTSLAGTMPASGLTLCSVDYGIELFPKEE